MRPHLGEGVGGTTGMQRRVRGSANAQYLAREFRACTAMLPGCAHDHATCCGQRVNGAPRSARMPVPAPSASHLVMCRLLLLPLCCSPLHAPPVPLPSPLPHPQVPGCHRPAVRQHGGTRQARGAAAAAGAQPPGGAGAGGGGAGGAWAHASQSQGMTSRNRWLTSEEG